LGFCYDSSACGEDGSGCLYTDSCGNCGTGCTGNVCDCGCNNYDALGICGGTCGDPSACSEDGNGCLYYDSLNGNCGLTAPQSIFTNASSDNLSDAGNWTNGVVPSSNYNVVINGFAYQDNAQIGLSGFASVTVTSTGLICDGVTISTLNLTNGSNFTGGYAEKYYTEGAFDPYVTGLYLDYYPPTGYAIFVDGVTGSFFSGGFNGLYYTLGVRNTDFNGTDENYSVVNGVLQHSTAIFANGVLVNAPGNASDDIISNLIGFPWDINRLTGLPLFIKL
jgi:hypothetical protein